MSTAHIQITKDITVSAMGRRFQAGEVLDLDVATATLLIREGYAFLVDTDADDRTGDSLTADTPLTPADIEAPEPEAEPLPATDGSITHDAPTADDVPPASTDTDAPSDMSPAAG